MSYKHIKGRWLMKKKLRQKIKETLEMPAEVIMDSPKVVLESNINVWIENYTEVIEYTQNSVKVNTNDFIIKIDGENLTIDFITNEDLSISGKILSVMYEVGE